MTPIMHTTFQGISSWSINICDKTYSFSIAHISLPFNKFHSIIYISNLLKKKLIHQPKNDVLNFNVCPPFLSIYIIFS